MTRTFALLLVVSVAACKSSGHTEKAQSDKEWSPKFEKTKVVYEVLDESTRARLGFVEKTTYGDGRVIYWVTGTDRSVRLGYMLPNNDGYKYQWVAGKRTDDPIKLGADTYEANARRILDHKTPVVFQEISLEKLLKEYEQATGEKPGEKPGAKKE
jgi:hypothetical protein